MSDPNSVVTLTLLDFPANIPLQAWSFDRQTPIRVGRATDNDVVIDNGLVSRYHLEILPGNLAQGWQVVNQGVNGTFLNDVLISRSPLPEEGFLQLAKDGPVLQFKTPAIPKLNKTTDPGSKKCNHAGNTATNLFCIRCRELLIPVQQSIGSYQVLKTLGQGGMGTTYLALDSMLVSEQSPLLVLKEINADLVEIAKAQELFTREARILQSLDHPSIPRYYASFIDQGKKYLALELIHGENLEDYVRRLGIVEVAKAVTWIQQVCHILEYLHSRTPPLIHRDIKPANLILRYRDDQIVLLDFGAVKEVGTPLKTKIGSEGGYSAPEQNQGQPCPQSDIYALGSTLIFLLTGKSPLDFYTKLEHGYGFDLQDVPGIPSFLQTLINQLTQEQPIDRPQTAKEVAQALGFYLQNLNNPSQD